MISEIFLLNKILKKTQNQPYRAFSYPFSVCPKNVFFDDTRPFHLKIFTIFTVCYKGSVDLLPSKTLYNQDKVSCIYVNWKIKNPGRRK